MTGESLPGAAFKHRPLFLKGGKNVFSLILMVFAFVLAVIAGFRTPSNPPFEVLGYRLICFALACFFLADILAKATGLHLIG